jgi:hypothetical protein
MKHNISRLYAPSGYRKASNKKIIEIANGCGPQGWLQWKRLNNFFGLSVKEACNIHDWMYHFGTTSKDKKMADSLFYNNMHYLIEKNTQSRFLQFLRFCQAFIYYILTKYFGYFIFRKNKRPY